MSNNGCKGMTTHRTDSAQRLYICELVHKVMATVYEERDRAARQTPKRAFGGYTTVTTVTS
jgi:hypothetical protein